jgi:hypothetical protein
MKIRTSFLLSFIVLTAIAVACGGTVTTQERPANCTVCSDLCVDVRVDRENCGACGNQCAAGQACSAGQCAPSCADGQTSCEGRCVDTASDPAHCGACGAKCAAPGAANACVAGKCAFGSCNAGFADCDGDQTNGCEKPVDADLANCGGCGVACAPLNATAPACAAGKCSYGTCSPGFADCDGDKANGCETNTSIETDHCGACNMKCTGGAACVSGACLNVPANVGKTSYAYPSDGNGGVVAPVPFTLTIQSVTASVIFYTTDGSDPSYTSAFAASPLALPIASNKIVKWMTSADPAIQTHNATIDATRQTCLGEFMEKVRFDGSGGPVIVASPGQVLTAKVDYRTWGGPCGYCPSCVRKPSYGISQTEGCYPNTFSYWPGDARVDLPIKVIAPAQPGIYRLKRNTQLDFACYIGRAVGGDDATIVVQ